MTTKLYHSYKNKENACIRCFTTCEDSVCLECRMICEYMILCNGKRSQVVKDKKRVVFV